MTSHIDISISPQSSPEAGRESPQHNFSNHVKENMSLIQTLCESNTQDNFVKKKSWRAPFVMLFSLLSATVLAVLHDRMNHSLNGNIVDPDGYWNQQWTSRYGTALAFLIRMFFVICVGVAFVQRQWLNLSTYQQAICVQNLDILSSALSTPFSLFSSPIWLRYPLLLTIALISWTLPFAAVITPGTLSVEPRPYIYSTDRSALRLSSYSDVFSVPYLEQTSESSSSYISATSDLSKLAFTVATSSQILSMRSDLANQTYFINFTGPALKCADASSTMTRKLSDLKLDGANVMYLAWIGNTAPWLQVENSTLQDYTFPTSAPDVFDPTIKNQIESTDTLWITTRNYTAAAPINLKECQLWNASYEIEFTYCNFEQTIVIHDFTYQNPILSISTSNMTAYDVNAKSNSFHKAILAGFGSLMVGANVGNESKNYRPSVFDQLGLLSTGNSTQLNEALEEVFQNITLSLFSIPEFLESPCYMIPDHKCNETDFISTNVTTWSNTYVYQQRDLLIAYGISFLASLMCCILGVHSFYRNGSSFQNIFSTYVRAAESSNFDIRATVSSGDTGADPLPKNIGETTITMASKQTR